MVTGGSAIEVSFVEILQKILRSLAYTSEGVLLGNRRSASASGKGFLAHFPPARAAHPHDGERFGVVLMVHLRLRAGAGDTGQALDLAALEVDLSVAAAVVLELLLNRQRMGCAMSPHLRCVTRTTVALVGASWVTAWAGCKGHGLEVYPVFVWSAIRLEFCKKFWGLGVLARLGTTCALTPLRPYAVTPFAFET
jgi:hypothetical protein